MGRVIDYVKINAWARLRAACAQNFKLAVLL